MGSVATVYLLLAYLWAPFRHGRALREAAPLIGRWVRRRSLPRPSYHQCECPGSWLVARPGGLPGAEGSAYERRLVGAPSPLARPAAPIFAASRCWPPGCTRG